jgi:hypothetical protein
MTTTLPVPIRFELPGPDWEAVPPESRGVTNAAFLAVRRGTGDSFEPTISISGDWRNDPASLEQIADESLVVARAQASEVELLKRRAMGTEHAPAITQLMGATIAMGGETFDLRQAQALTGLVDVEDPTKRVVVIYSFTCTYRQFEAYGPEFQDFMRTVRVVPDDEVPDDPAS